MSRSPILAGLAVALLLAFCQTPAEAQPKRGGTLNMLVEPEPPALSTIAHTAGPSTKVSGKVLEGLLTYDYDLTPKPQLATEWSVSEDGLRYSFKLREGVLWHDGKPFTSADVAASIAILKQYHPRGRGTFANVVTVETPDPLRATIVLSKPAPYLITAFAASESPIVPKHIYEGSDPTTNPKNNAPIGTGPYVFKEWVRGSHIIYERNPNYWDKPKPYIDRLVVKFIPDAAARAVAFDAGTVDLGGETPVPLSELERLKQDPKIGIEDKGYSYSPSVQRIEFNFENKYLKDMRVRRAIAHAIDRRVILNTVWYGYGELTNTPISTRLTQFHDPSVKGYAFDPRKAEQLLDEAGFKRGADGVRFRLTHDFLPYGDGFRRTADYLRQALAKVGIEVTIRSQDFATYIKRVYTDRDFDFTNNSMGNTFDPTVGVQRLYWSKNFKKGVPFSNGSGINNPEIDALLEAATVETDPIKRKQEFARFQQIIAEEIPSITILTVPNLTIYNRKVKDHTVGADGLNGNLAGVWISP
ncbi:ABC transporter substrate-binding protein [Bosea sp. RCC_152_1]|uniref:ABC transporter substrate-binding protein n=1 Tax=Bosea sp. RCC_152_1 TaxID=3239228 RepID=UPI0035255DCB